MKKPWRPFLLKLFLPGILALPWLLDIPLEFIPEPYFDGDVVNYEWNGIEAHLKPLAFCGVLFAVMSPLILFKHKPTWIRRILLLCWPLSLGLFAAKEWPSYSSIFDDMPPVLIQSLIGVTCVVIAISYLFLFIRAQKYDLKPFRIHYGAVIASMVTFLALMLLLLFGHLILGDSSMINSSKTQAYLTTVRIGGSVLVICLALSAITHYVAAILYYRKGGSHSAELIDEIGTS